MAVVHFIKDNTIEIVKISKIENFQDDFKDVIFDVEWSDKRGTCVYEGKIQAIGTEGQFTSL